MAIREYYSTREVADMFCVSVPTIRSWRTPAYEDSPLRLVGERVGHNDYRYSLDTLDAFVERNPRFNPFLAATLKRGTPVFPKDVVAALRDTPAPPGPISHDHPSVDAWSGFFTAEQQHTSGEHQ